MINICTRTRLEGEEPLLVYKSIDNSAWSNFIDYFGINSENDVIAMILLGGHFGLKNHEFWGSNPVTSGVKAINLLGVKKPMKVVGQFLDFNLDRSIPYNQGSLVTHTKTSLLNSIKTFLVPETYEGGSFGWSVAVDSESFEDLGSLITNAHTFNSEVLVENAPKKLIVERVNQNDLNFLNSLDPSGFYIDCYDAIKSCLGVKQNSLGSNSMPVKTVPEPINGDVIEIVYQASIQLPLPSIQAPVNYGLHADYPGTGWYKATDTGIVFSKDVPNMETMQFEEGGIEYVSVYNANDAYSYGASAATSNITNMSGLFSEVWSGQDVSTWDVSNVTTMNSMFSFTQFNGDISNWDVSSVTDMSYMFFGDNTFNQDISNWDVSKVIDMRYMFNNSVSFNQDISNWDVSNVTDMESMFRYTYSFNQNLGSWNVSNVTNMETMFEASAINYDLSAWDISNVTRYLDFSTNSSLTLNQLPNWPIVISPPGEGLRADYPGTGWYKATDTGTVFNKYIPEGETYTFSDNTSYTSVYNASDAGSLGKFAATSNITDMSTAFYSLTTFNDDISGWDFSNVTNASHMFSNARAFNQDLTNWDTSSLVNMTNMFSNALAFNGDISNWDTSNVTSMTSTFQQAAAFNQDISNWDTSNVTSMSTMFAEATNFNANISYWNTSKVVSMYGMFADATSFNQYLAYWNVSNIPTIPDYFDSNATAWIQSRPIWGTVGEEFAV